MSKKSPTTLSELGYTLNKPAVNRRSALRKSVKKHGFKPTIDKVNLLYVYSKNRSPVMAKKVVTDKNWLLKQRDKMK